MPRQLPGSEVLAALLAPVEPDFAGEVVLVDGPIEGRPDELDRARLRLGTLPCLLLATPGAGPDGPAEPSQDPWGPAASRWPADQDGGGRRPDLLVDAVAVDDDDLEAMLATATANPIASLALAVHLRTIQDLPPDAGLVAESALYSALQAGPEHRAWREETPTHDLRPDDDRPRVTVERLFDELLISLDRPAARNALDARMRDELLEALAIAHADPSLTVVLKGEGLSFCAGGDLDEFGTRSDPASAHLLRLRRSVAAALFPLADRTVAYVHGASAGSGVELAAIAGEVVADPHATFRLPELTMGLVPGAGGTVSLPARIGRHETLRLCLLARPIGASDAQRLGLVDEVVRLI